MKSDEIIYHFAQANPDGSDASISDLLRRVADTIDERKGAIVDDVVMDLAKVEGEQANLSVYYRYSTNIEHLLPRWFANMLPI